MTAFLDDPPSPRPSGSGSARVLPSNLQATILAWPLAPNTVAVALRVGVFGDRAEESVFMGRLADTLKDKPIPKRGGSLVLPD